jgi:hypothetical protein
MLSVTEQDDAVCVCSRTFQWISGRVISTKAATISALFNAQLLLVEISPTKTHQPTR